MRQALHWFTQQETDSNRDFGWVTPNGVVWHEMYYTPKGCKFVLICEGQPENVMHEAADWLREQRDVIGISLGAVKEQNK